MAQYDIGTVAVTAGSSLVTASADADWTAFQNGARSFFVKGSNSTYSVATVRTPVVNASGRWELNLNAPFAGVTAAAATYILSNSFSPVLGLPLLSYGDGQGNVVFSRAMLLLENIITPIQANVETLLANAPALGQTPVVGTPLIVQKVFARSSGNTNIALPQAGTPGNMLMILCIGNSGVINSMPAGFFPLYAGSDQDSQGGFVGIRQIVAGEPLPQYTIPHGDVGNVALFEISGAFNAVVSHAALGGGNAPSHYVSCDWPNSLRIVAVEWDNSSHATAISNPYAILQNFGPDDGYNHCAIMAKTTAMPASAFALTVPGGTDRPFYIGVEIYGLVGQTPGVQIGGPNATNVRLDGDGNLQLRNVTTGAWRYPVFLGQPGAEAMVALDTYEEVAINWSTDGAGNIMIRNADTGAYRYIFFSGQPGGEVIIASNTAT